MTSRNQQIINYLRAVVTHASDVWQVLMWIDWCIIETICWVSSCIKCDDSSLIIIHWPKYHEHSTNTVADVSHLHSLSLYSRFFTHCLMLIDASYCGSKLSVVSCQQPRDVSLALRVCCSHPHAASGRALDIELVTQSSVHHHLVHLWMDLNIFCTNNEKTNTKWQKSTFIHEHTTSIRVPFKWIEEYF